MLEIILKMAQAPNDAYLVTFIQKRMVFIRKRKETFGKKWVNDL